MLKGCENIANDDNSQYFEVAVREYFYSVIFEITDKHMQFAELKNTPKQKKNWYFDNFDKSKSRNTASGSWFGQKYVN